jgi:hypothetical protein
MNELSMELWSFSFSNKIITLTINRPHGLFWKEFFQDLENGVDLNVSISSLLRKISKSDFDVDMIWEKHPNYFLGNIKDNIDKLKNDSEFQSLLREIRINKIID